MVTVDAFSPARLSFSARFWMQDIMDWPTPDEADIQATESQKSQHTWIPRTDENSRRPKGSQSSSEAGSRSTGSLDRPQVALARADRSEHFPRSVRIRRSNEIQEILQQGKRESTGNLEIFFASPKASVSRFGLIVPKHGQRIVDRNRLKRRLREIGRRRVIPHLRSQGREGDVLIRATRSAYRASFSELEREINEAVEGFCSEES